MIKLYFYCQRFLNNIRPWEKIIILGCQTFRNKAHGIGGPGAEVTRIVNGPFLSYRDFCMAIATPGLVREWFYFTARDSRTSPGLAGEGLNNEYGADIGRNSIPGVSSRPFSCQSFNNDTFQFPRNHFA